MASSPDAHPYLIHNHAPEMLLLFEHEAVVERESREPAPCAPANFHPSVPLLPLTQSPTSVKDLLLENDERLDSKDGPLVAVDDEDELLVAAAPRFPIASVSTSARMLFPPLRPADSMQLTSTKATSQRKIHFPIPSTSIVANTTKPQRKKSNLTTKKNKTVHGLWPTEDCSTNRLAALSARLHTHICSYISVMEQQQLFQVSQRWRNTVSWHWRHCTPHLDLSAAPASRTATFLTKHFTSTTRGVKYGNPLLSLVIHGHGQCPDVLLPALVAVATTRGLQELCLAEFATLTDAHIHALLLLLFRRQGGCLVLRTIRVQGCPLTTRAATLRSVTALCPSHMNVWYNNENLATVSPFSSSSKTSSASLSSLFAPLL